MQPHVSYQGRHSRPPDPGGTGVAVADSGPRPAGRTASIGAVVLPSLVTLTLGGVFLGRASISTDEAATWINAVQPPSVIVRNSAHIDVMFLPYYLFMHVWILPGEALWWLRLPSLIAAAATVAALVLLARRWLPVAYSALAGLLLSFNPLFAEWSMQARPYTAATFFAVMSMAALAGVLDREGLAGWVRYGLAVFGMLASQLISVFVLLSQWLVVAVSGRWPAWRGALITLTCVAVGVSPVVILAAGQTGQVAWIPALTPHTFTHALFALSGGPVGAAELAVCSVIVAGTAFSPTVGADRRFGSALSLSWAATPSVGLILVSFFRPLYVDRYALVSVPGIALIEAMGIWRAWSFLAEARHQGVAGHRDLGWKSLLAMLACIGACAATVALIVGSSQVFRQRSVIDDYRSAAAALSVDLSRRPAPVAVIPGWAGAGFAYYIAPPVLARALRKLEASALDRHLLDWQPVIADLGATESTDRILVLPWPAGAVSRDTEERCIVGWAIGRGELPDRFTAAGSSCHLSQVRHYGAVWVASAGP
jgi:hypothetical protein